MKLDLTESGNISLNDNNVMEIMRFIVNNNITNVRHYIKSELGIEPTRYYSKVKQIGVKYPKYYEYYINNLNKNIDIMKEKIKYLLLYIGTFMKYGVELEDGSFREFDVFDWYIIKKRYFNDLNRKELSLIIDELSKEPIIVEAKVNIYAVRRMISIAFNDQPVSSSYSIHKDYILNDTKSGLTDEEKKYLVKYMEKNDIPITYANYEIGRQKVLKQRENKNDLFNLNIYVNEDIKQDNIGIELDSLKIINVLKIMKYIIDNNIVNIKYFLKNELNVKNDLYNRQLLKVKEKYPEEYELYKSITEKNYDDFKEDAKIVLLYILVFKKYGIELKDGSFRRFDLFDFYVLKNKYLENFGKKDLLVIYEELFKENNAYLSNFDYLSLRLLLNSSGGFVYSSYDNLDLPISNESILMLEDELNIEEKKFLINFMEQNKIPFTFGNYKFGIEKMMLQRKNLDDIFNLDLYFGNVKKRIK